MSLLKLAYMNKKKNAYLIEARTILLFMVMRLYFERNAFFERNGCRCNWVQIDNNAIFTPAPPELNTSFDLFNSTICSTF